MGQDAEGTNVTRGVVTAVGLVVLSAIPLYLLGTEYPELLHLARDPHGAEAAEALTARGTDLDRLRQGLTADTLFALAYGTALAVACVLPTARLVRYRSAGRFLACLGVAGAAFDMVENHAMARLVGQGAGAVAHPRFEAVRSPGDIGDWARTALSDRAAVVRLEYAFWAKWALVVVPVLFALGAVTTWAAGRAKAPTRGRRALRRALDDVDNDRGGWGPPRFHLPDHSKPGKRLLRWLTVQERSSVHLDPPRTATRAPDNPEKGVVGICFSGGGIRSAAYNLGALQELQANGVLGRADYLAAVSGGSYIASAYSLAATCSEADAIGTMPPFAPGSPEEQYLRNHTNYLVPGPLGFAYALWRLLRGLLLNIAFVLLLLFLVARPYGWFLQDRFVAPQGSVCPTEQTAASAALETVPLGEWRETPDNKGRSCRDVEFRHLPWGMAAVGGVGALALVLGLIDLLLRPRERVARQLEQWSLRLLGVAVVGALLLFVLPALGAKLLDDAGVRETSQERLAIGGAGLGVLTSMIGSILAVLGAGPGKGTGAAKDKPSLVDKARDGIGKVAMGTKNLLLILAGAVIGPLAFAAAGIVIAIGGVVERLTPADVGLWLFVLAAVALVQGVGDINRWSVHPYYKRSLQSAFALKRRCDGDHAFAEEIPFNQRITFPHLLDSPKLLVCAAVNVTNQGMLPPGRPVSTFTFCRTEVDAGLLGRVGTGSYSTLLGPHFERDFTVPAAVAASGAAFSPVMGKMTKPHLRFLLALANLRLGVWLPNPARVREWAQSLDVDNENDGPSSPSPAQARAAAALAQAERAAAEARAKADAAVAEHRQALERTLDLLAAGALDEDAVASARRATARAVATAEAEATAARLAVERAKRTKDEADLDDADDERVVHEGFPWVPRPTLLLRELFGRFRADSRFVYVTDGGHYENLGLVELVRRGCTEIYCFDAAGDQLDAFTTLADAVSIARTELGVEIEIDPRPMEQGDGDVPNRTDHVIGRIYYPGAEDRPGRIVFAKAAVTADIPAEVRSWRQGHPRFPTDGTDDQLYTDQRFEAYRTLGAYTANRAIATMDEAVGRTPIRASAPDRLGSTC